jgi:ATP-dependent exoDNAse (exonuclease V) alpha subunit
LITSRHNAARALNQEARRLIGLEGIGVNVAVTDRECLPNGTREIASGDRLIARRNSRELRLANGQFMTVETIRQTGSTARIMAIKDNGECIEIDTSKYASLEHGYAITIHSGQETTVERTIMHISDPSMVDIHSTYVGASRSREQTEIVISRYALEEAVILQETDVADTVDQQQDLASLMKAMGRERLKEVSVDFQVME